MPVGRGGGGGTKFGEVKKGKPKSLAVTECGGERGKGGQTSSKKVRRE